MSASSYQQTTSSPLHSNSLSGSFSGAVEAVEVESSSSFFSANSSKNEDLKQMLDSSKDSEKLEAMKRIIGGMVARGKDASSLFPNVVKNVVSRNIEVKKLVYVYLVRYAEQLPDLALLSISTFQRALKDPNQLIRASALRVLSSIRVPVIVPILMLAIRESSVDMSPFVRKTAAHAIPKLYSLDSESKEELIGIIEKLLGDRTTLVVGSAVMAFEEVCPERIELIHKNYRKLCNLLVDVEEWGQIVIVNMLTRYARSQFVDPNLSVDRETENVIAGFYEDFSEKNSVSHMDTDHRTLLKAAKPLLQSRNAAVVMATAQLYNHCAPRAEIQVVAKAMVRLLRSHREVQIIVLNSIASMTSCSSKRNSMFDSHLKIFFVRSSDSTTVKILKLEIITNLATETNIAIILREFQSYITGQDTECVTATIEAIGRCASSIPEVKDTCLNGLVYLLSNGNGNVVAQSVIVIKKLLQTNSGEQNKDIIQQMAKLLTSIDVPAARAAILWVIGEYSNFVPKLAPDVLRKMVKSFISEDDCVKLQILNLSVKLALNNPKQTKILALAIFNMAKYDMNYDIRDRTRFLRVFIFPPSGHENDFLLSQAANIFLSPKLAPLSSSKFNDRSNYTLGSMSHYLNRRVNGYVDLPIFPIVASDASLRDVEPIKVSNPWEKFAPSHMENLQQQHSEDDYSGTSDEDEDSSESSSSSTLSTEKMKKNIKLPESSPLQTKQQQQQQSSSSSSSSSSSISSSSSSEDEESEKEFESTIVLGSEKVDSYMDLLLDLSNEVPSCGSFLTPGLAIDQSISESSPEMKDAAPMYVSIQSNEILNKMTSGGLQVLYRFTRSDCLYSSVMTNVEMTLVNQSNNIINDVKVGQKILNSGMSLHEFPEVSSIQPGCSIIVNMGINFNDSTHPASFDLLINNQAHKISLTAPVGELIKAVSMSENTFHKKQNLLCGMYKTQDEFSIHPLCNNSEVIKRKIYEIANVLFVPTLNDQSLLFAGLTIANKSIVLISLTLQENSPLVQVLVNCEKMVFSSLLIKDIKTSLSSSA